jgi:hypothetical protein
MKNPGKGKHVRMFPVKSIKKHVRMSPVQSIKKQDRMSPVQTIKKQDRISIVQSTNHEVEFEGVLRDEIKFNHFQTSFKTYYYIISFWIRYFILGSFFVLRAN